MKTLTEIMNMRYGRRFGKAEKAECVHVMNDVRKINAFETLCLICAELNIDLSNVSEISFESASIVLDDFCKAANDETGYTVSVWFDKDEKQYMNTETSSVDTYDGWNYTNEAGENVNAVDLGEVVEVTKDKNGDWIEV